VEKEKNVTLELEIC